MNTSAVCLSVAGINVAVTCNDEDVLKKISSRYAEFSTDAPANLRVRLWWENGPKPVTEIAPAMVFRQGILEFTTPGYLGTIRASDGEAELRLVSGAPLEDLDYFIRAVYSLLIFQVGGLLIHGAGIVRNGQAYIFLGHSGSGKTTVARLSVNDLILNDDLIAVMPQRSGWLVYGTPFWNSTQVRPTAHSAPLRSLYRLAQDRKVFREIMEPGESLAELVSNTPIISASVWLGPQLLERCGSLLHTIPMYRLHFLPDASFWRVVEASPEGRALL